MNWDIFISPYRLGWYSLDSNSTIVQLTNEHDDMQYNKGAGIYMLETACYI